MIQQYLKKELILKAATLALIMPLALAGCSYVNKKFGLKDDHMIEQLSEDVIYKQTGLRVDLTPEPNFFSFELD